MQRHGYVSMGTTINLLFAAGIAVGRSLENRTSEIILKIVGISHACSVSQLLVAATQVQVPTMADKYMGER